MKYLVFPFRSLWRIWFYVLMISSLIIISPILFILLTKDNNYPKFWKVIRAWSYLIVYGMGFRLRINRDQELDPKQSYMFCSNHSSLLDGFVMIITSKNPIVFVGKKELTKVPIFGYFYKRAVITVDRSSPDSRRKVYEEAKKRLKNGTSIAIFPEGLVPTEDVVLAPFKNGAFSLAIEHQIPIVPQLYYDAKRLLSWDFYSGYPGVFRVHQLKFINTKGLKPKDKNELRETTFSLIEQMLLKDQQYMKDTNKHVKK